MRNILLTPLTTVAQKCHGNFNFITAISTSFTAISTSFTAISISPRQFQLRSRQFQFHHGNFNFVHGNFNFTTAISISSRQFQFHHVNFTTAISTSFTAISTSPRQFQFHLLSPHFPFPLPRSQGLYGHLRWMTWRKNLKYKFQSLRIICLPQNAKHSRT